MGTAAGEVLLDEEEAAYDFWLLGGEEGGRKGSGLGMQTGKNVEGVEVGEGDGEGA